MAHPPVSTENQNTEALNWQPHKTSQSNGWCLVAAVQKVQSIPVVTALKKTGVLREVKQVSGASAGAMTAAVIAVGMPTKIFRERLLKENLKDLLGKNVTTSDRPGVVPYVTKDGSGIIQLLRDNIHYCVTAFLKTSPPSSRS